MNEGKDQMIVKRTTLRGSDITWANISRYITDTSTVIIENYAKQTTENNKLCNSSRQITGKDESNKATLSSKELVEEGPIFLTSNKVRGEPLMMDLLEKMQQMWDKDLIRFIDKAYDVENAYIYYMIITRINSKVLILSGSHGSKDGISGLTDKSEKNVDEGYTFYKEDCHFLGIKPGPPKRCQRLPLKDWTGIPDITKSAEKLLNCHESFQNSRFKDMDFRVCNICYYHGLRKASEFVLFDI